MQSIELVEWGLLDYEESLDRQHRLVEARQRDECGDMLISVQHPHVFTLGRRREALANVLNPGDVPVIEIERGGDVTYHGPGQLILYPICKLQEEERDLHQFLRNMEQGIIDSLVHSKIFAGRQAGKTGVWIEGRKLASMGIACRKWVTFHGLALNVNCDLSYFSRINPCGFSSSVMSSIQAEKGDQEICIETISRQLQRDLCRTLSRSPT